MIIVGVDPGKTGAIVALESLNNQGYYLPLKYSRDGLLEFGSIRTLFEKLKPSKVYLEKSKGRGGWSATAVHSTGDSYGQIRFAIARAMQAPHVLVDPKAWQRPIHEGIKKSLTAKERSLVAYNNLFPLGAIPPGPKGGKPGDGIIDALLIAVYGMEKSKQGLQPWRCVLWGL